MSHSASVLTHYVHRAHNARVVRFSILALTLIICKISVLRVFVLKGVTDSVMGDTLFQKL